MKFDEWHRAASITIGLSWSAAFSCGCLVNGEASSARVPESTPVPAQEPKSPASAGGQHFPADAAASHPHRAVAIPEPELTRRIREKLGPVATSIVESPELVEVGRLRVIPAIEAENNTLVRDDRILGYPVEEKLAALDSSESATIVRELLDDGHYDFARARRCRNQYFVGLRFEASGERVEFALGMGCHQVLWASVMKTDEGVEVSRWGGSISPELARRVVGLLPTAN